jgi:hypothetical protein
MRVMSDRGKETIVTMIPIATNRQQRRRRNPVGSRLSFPT